MQGFRQSHDAGKAGLSIKQRLEMFSCRVEIKHGRPAPDTTSIHAVTITGLGCCKCTSLLHNPCAALQLQHDAGRPSIAHLLAVVYLPDQQCSIVNENAKCEHVVDSRTNLTAWKAWRNQADPLQPKG